MAASPAESSADRIVTPGSEISRDTHVGADFDRVATRPATARPTADPDALVAHNRVSTGHELETPPDTESESDPDPDPE